MKDLRSHYTTPAIISVLVLTALLGVGIWLMLDNQLFADQAVITAPTTETTDGAADIVPATPSPTL